MTKDDAFAKLARSKFRSRLKLAADDLAYIDRVGLETIRRHAEDFVREKLGPAEPRNDGKQIPMRGHPIFKAMHGSAMCCRGCMEKWWHVKRGIPLTDKQRAKAVATNQQPWADWFASIFLDGYGELYAQLQPIVTKALIEISQGRK